MSDLLTPEQLAEIRAHVSRGHHLLPCESEALLRHAEALAGERDAQYAENVERIAAQGAAEAKAEAMARENARLRGLVPVPDAEGLRFGSNCWMSFESIKPHGPIVTRAFLDWVAALREATYKDATPAADAPEPQECETC